MIGFLTVLTSGRAEPLAVGAKAPTVTGNTDAGATLDFSTVYSKGYTLVYFYPMAGSAEDTTEAVVLNDAYDKLSAKGVTTIIGVSTDDTATIKAFKEKNHLPFTLISDPGHTVLKAFGVPTSEQWGTGPRAMRQSFLINKDGQIVWRDLEVVPKHAAKEVLKALKAQAK